VTVLEKQVVSRVRVVREKQLSRDDHLLAERGQRLTHEFLVRERAIGPPDAVISSMTPIRVTLKT
jgi:hypothetical protein